MVPPTLIAVVLRLITNKYVASILAVLILASSAYFYYWWSSSKLKAQSQEIIRLSEIVETQQEEIQKLDRNYKAIVKSHNDLFDETIRIRSQTRDLARVLYREHDKKKSIEELALSKTSLIEQKVNRATADVLNCFEKISIGEECP